jgi:hypothetical protein
MMISMSPKVRRALRKLLLWPDTPHAAWTWLEQISRHFWDGATLAWTEPNVIDGIYTKQDPLNRGRLDFVENEHVKNEGKNGGYEAWTVIGLKRTETGQLGMFFNRQDNNQHYKRKSSVGKIIDGLDALQRLLEASRNVNNNDNNEKRFGFEFFGANNLGHSAMHITHRESLMLVGKL